MLVRELMTSPVTTVGPDATLHEIARIMRDEDIGSVPVALDGRLVGMVTDRDIVIRGIALDGSVHSSCAHDVMSPQVLYCLDDQEVDAVLRRMREEQIRRLPVVDEDRRLVGVISLGDLSGKARAAKVGETLKEISRPVSA